MGVYDRNAKHPDRKPNWWISYTVTEYLRAQFDLPERTVREPGGPNQRASGALLAQRRREVRDGTWVPRDKLVRKTFREYSSEWCATREAAGVKNVKNEHQRLRDHAWPVIGSKPIDRVTRSDIKTIMARVADHVSAKTGRPLAPRSQLVIYRDLTAVFKEAIADQLIIASPCTLREKRGELPPNKDQSPGWRSQAIFTREEAEMLMSDERIELRHRVLYALVFLGGMRVGEAIARKWGDIDTVAKPLARLRIESQHDGDELKTEDPREMPIHPTLARLLAEWKMEGYELACGRAPTAELHIVPNRPKRRDRGLPVPGKNAWEWLQKDLAKLGLRRRRMHDTRRTFISLALADGADKYLLKFCTHGRPRKDAFDDYATPPWSALCEQVAKLQLRVRGGENVIHGRFATQR